MPAKLRMTVPLRFRRNSEIPRVLVLHYADIPESDIEMVHGVRVTKPMRTILDLLEQEEMPIALLRQALQEGLRRGIIRRGEIAEATWRGVKGWVRHYGHIHILIEKSYGEGLAPANFSRRVTQSRAQQGLTGPAILPTAKRPRAALRSLKA
jgi:hypothetical protein